jgi:sec-independent protein translocase protein TatA
VTPSPIQLIIVLVIVLLLFGAKKIPELAKGLGTGMREFRQGASGELADDKNSESSDGSESKVDKEASAKPAGNDDARSEDEPSDEKANKTEQRS